VRQKFPVGVNSARSAGGGIVLVVVDVVDVVVGMLVVVDVVVCVTTTLPGAAGGFVLQLSASAVSRTPVTGSSLRIRKSPSHSSPVVLNP
jgi:uncharacterized YccA/Bax inhibitor family protein